MITIKDVALAAGVSIATVSRVLTGNKRVSDKVKKRTLKIVKELNYIPNLSARALTGKSTKLIGMVVPEIRSNFYAQMVDLVESEMSARGYTLVIVTTGFDANKGLEILDILMGRKVDGILYADGVNDENKALFESRLMNSNPIVFLGSAGESMGYESILVDDGYGISLLVKHLAALGHKSIGFIGEDLSREARLLPFKKALDELGLIYNEKFIKADGKERFEAGGYLRMKEMLAGGELPTAVVASYDYIAMGAMKALHESGLSVPGDMSIVGFDNVRESEYLITPLTTIYPPVKEMTQRAVDSLIEMIENDRKSLAARTVILPQLIVRQSTSAPKQ